MSKPSEYCFPHPDFLVPVKFKGRNGTETNKSSGNFIRKSRAARQSNSPFPLSSSKCSLMSHQCSTPQPPLPLPSSSLSSSLKRLHLAARYTNGPFAQDSIIHLRQEPFRQSPKLELNQCISSLEISSFRSLGLPTIKESKKKREARTETNVY